MHCHEAVSAVVRLLPRILFAWDHWRAARPEAR